MYAWKPSSFTANWPLWARSFRWLPPSEPRFAASESVGPSSSPERKLVPASPAVGGGVNDPGAPNCEPLMTPSQSSTPPCVVLSHCTSDEPAASVVPATLRQPRAQVRTIRWGERHAGFAARSRLAEHQEAASRVVDDRHRAR